MNNHPNKNNLRRAVNEYQEDFSQSYQEMNTLAQTYQNINSDQFHQNVLGNEYEESATALENKIKFLNKSGKVSFLSGKSIDKYRESLKNLGVLPSKKEEYLQLRKLPIITLSDFENLKNSIIDEENLKKLLNTLNNVNCNFKSFQSESVGCILPLTYLIESKFSMNKEKIKEINDKYNSLKPFICNYRTINGDGNCFYRAVMFRYLEILILNEKIDDLRNVINDVVNSFKSEELKKRRIINNSDVKPELTFKILILIESLLNNKQKEKAHEILVKSFSTCRKFDYAIILYFRYILYDYIKKNENKVYLKSFPIKIGNLLPSQYETNEGEFLFDSFYEYYLLKFYTFAEKIIIYLTPLVLGIELNIIIFEDNDDEIVKKFRWEGNSNLNVNDVISLVISKNHYEIIYNLKDNEQYKNIFVNYENNQKSVIIANIDKLLKEINESKNFNIMKESINELGGDLKEMNTRTMIKKKQNLDNNIDNQIKNNNIQNNYLGKDNNNVYTKNIINNNINNNQVRNNNNNKQINDYIQGNNNPNINMNNNNNNQINNYIPGYNNNPNNNMNYKNNNQINNNIPGYNNKPNINMNNSNNNQVNNYNQPYNNNPNIYMNNYHNQDKYLNNEINNNIANNQLNQGKFNEINNNNNLKTPLQQNNNNNIKKTEQNMTNNNFTFNNNQNHLNNNKEIGLKTPGQNLNSNQSNQLNPNNQNQNTKQIGFKTPGQNTSKNICMSCKKVEIENNNINICKYCFKKILFEELYSSYLEYIKSFQNTKFKGRIEIKLRNDENKKNFLLDEAIEEYNKNYKNENLNYQQVINELKKRVCALCQEDLKNESIKIPCNCHFCSKKHLELFLKPFNFSKDFICYCGEKYSREMIFDLGILCNDLNVPSKSKLIKYFNSKLYLICCICGKTSNISYYSIMVVSLNDQNQRSVNNFLNQLTHYFCESCGKNFNTEFNCQICKINHFCNNINYFQQYYG